ncbi:uncharacterized protein HD556DRAFT_1307969 [Suillus plorans]|uniref:AAA ATPase AAA+ lid domain-containing protein n=1 Tax=Suillus plorans TaxID=116603 RepID=A0A9P7AR25_9AGAM|nr:uncharacterized protein HD556DRAFT_1307969 [Suillus plorans]KAG1794607.1 hypothetical protein HD556DRAFT_1307969 [Suillus plorans]
MDGVQELVRVTIIAATNRPDVIARLSSDASRKTGSHSIRWTDHAGREKISKIRTRTMSMESDLDLHTIAAMTDGCCGAEVSSLCQDALLTMQKDINAPFTQEPYKGKSRQMRSKDISNGEIKLDQGVSELIAMAQCLRTCCRPARSKVLCAVTITMDCCLSHDQTTAPPVINYNLWRR